MDPDLDYLILATRADDTGATETAARVRLLLAEQEPRLRPVFESEHVAILIDPTRVRLVRDRANLTILLGSLFDKAGNALDDMEFEALVAGTSFATDKAKTIVDRCWGRYLAVLLPLFGTRGIQLVRDPLGMMPAYRFVDGGLTLISSSVPRALVKALKLAIAPDMDLVGQAVAHPPLVTFQSLLRGVDLLPAGAMVSLHGDTTVPLWRPAIFAAGHGTGDPAEAAERLRVSVMMCCRAWSNHVGPLVIELSGGLDSAILLGAMAGGGAASLSAVNFTTGYCEGDERRHAQAAALRYGIPLVELDADAENLDYDLLFDAVPSAAPRLYGLDPQHEEMIVATTRQLGAAAIATGQGGDALFFQLPTPLIAVDHARAGGLSLRASLIAAQRAGCSVWHVLQLMVRDRWNQRPGPRDRYDQTLLTKAFRDQLTAAPPAHPWLAECNAFPPAKRLQIEAIANCQLFFTPTRRGRVAPLLHPLLSQPIVEACLSIPTYVLAPDARDRGLARDIFADLVPASIIARTGKGEASCYYNRALVGNLPLIREWLLDGELVRAGILDRATLDTVLDEDHLLWADAARPPLLYASIEAWLRYWSE